jgi:cytidylate kinase
MTRLSDLGPRICLMGPSNSGKSTLAGAIARKCALDGNRDSVKWEMIHHIAVATARNRRRYADLFDGIRLPKVKLATARSLDRFYRDEGLDR